MGFSIADMRFSIADMRFMFADMRSIIADMRFAIADMRSIIADMRLGCDDYKIGKKKKKKRKKRIKKIISGYVHFRIRSFQDMFILGYVRYESSGLSLFRLGGIPDQLIATRNKLSSNLHGRK